MKPVPGSQYKKLQKEMTALENRYTFTKETRRRELRHILELQFMQAWGLLRDKYHTTYRLKCHMSDLGLDLNYDFDHCTFYRGQSGSRIIVSQPYNYLKQKDWEGVRGPDGEEAVITLAHEWGFYYPKHAGLVIILFSPPKKNSAVVICAHAKT